MFLYLFILIKNSLFQPSVVTCKFNIDSSQFALEYCTRSYGVCSADGVLTREECVLGYLFDQYTRSCVLASECGQKKLDDLITQVSSSLYFMMI